MDRDTPRARRSVRGTEQPAPERGTLPPEGLPVTWDRAFLTFTRLREDSHVEYNAWHQLDHLPENLRLPGVVWGDRWVCPADCRPFVSGSDADAGYQYAVMYWFREPLEAAVREWTDLNQRAIWWGRRPELAYTDRHPVGFLTPVHSHAAPRVLVAAGAIPMRPHHGVHVTVSRFALPVEPEAAAHLARHEAQAVPALLDTPGVAGVSTYTLHSDGEFFGDPRWTDRGIVVRVIHLDDDPVEVAPAIGALVAENAEPGIEHVLWSGPLRTIVPGRWTWFDPHRPDAPDTGGDT